MSFGQSKFDYPDTRLFVLQGIMALALACPHQDLDPMEHPLHQCDKHLAFGLLVEGQPFSLPVLVPCWESASSENKDETKVNLSWGRRCRLQVWQDRELSAEEGEDRYDPEAVSPKFLNQTGRRPQGTSYTLEKYERVGLCLKCGSLQNDAESSGS